MSRITHIECACAPIQASTLTCVHALRTIAADLLRMYFDTRVSYINRWNWNLIKHIHATSAHSEWKVSTPEFRVRRRWTLRGFLVYYNHAIPCCNQKIIWWSYFSWLLACLFEASCNWDLWWKTHGPLIGSGDTYTSLTIWLFLNLNISQKLRGYCSHNERRFWWVSFWVPNNCICNDEVLYELANVMGSMWGSI
jgi:hypothetical protein